MTSVDRILITCNQNFSTVLFFFFMCTHLSSILLLDMWACMCQMNTHENTLKYEHGPNCFGTALSLITLLTFHHVEPLLAPCVFVEEMLRLHGAGDWEGILAHMWWRIVMLLKRQTSLYHTHMIHAPHPQSWSSHMALRQGWQMRLSVSISF